jgi:small subunit ribosomal protein S25e
MGANKKRSSTSSEKTASSGVGEKKERKEDRAEDRGTQKQKLAVFVEESQGRKTLQSMKAITAQGFAKASGVKISAANSFIKSLELKGVLTSVGGYSGHRVYKLIK